MATASMIPSQLFKPFELGENLVAGDPVYIYDDSGTTKIKKVYSVLDSVDTEFKGYYQHSCMISTDKVVVVYRDLNNNSYTTVKCGTVQADSSIIWGNSVVAYTAFGYYQHIDKVGTNKFVVIYRGTGSKGSAKIGTVSGNTIILGLEYQFSQGYGYDQTCCYVSDNKFAVAFRDAGVVNHGFCRIGVVGAGLDRTISWGTAKEYGASSSYENWICVPDPATEKIAIFYRRTVGTTNAWCRAATISGDGIGTFSTETRVGNYPYYSCAESIATDKVAYAYRDTSDGNKLKAIIIIFDGTTVEVDLADTTTIDGHTAYYTALCKLADNEFVIAWEHWIAPYEGKLCKNTVSGTTITKGSDQSYQSEHSYYNTLTRLSDTKYFLLWYSTTDTVSNYIVVEGELNLLDYTTGLMRETGSLGETKKVDILGGITEQLSGLTPGSHYYIQDDATIGITHTSYHIGIALSSTSMLIIKTY